MKQIPKLEKEKNNMTYDPIRSLSNGFFDSLFDEEFVNKGSAVNKIQGRNGK